VRGFETLVEAGYQPDVDYFDCMHEFKVFVDLLLVGVLIKINYFVSDTAMYGDLRGGPRIIDAPVRDNMKQVLKEVQDGTFAKQWIEENKGGQKNYKRLMQEDLDQQIEKVGKDLRGRMSWLQE
jgi:ketol-acid reductoisomerase